MFKLFTWIHHVDQQNAAWFESSFYVSCSSYIMDTLKDEREHIYIASLTDAHNISDAFEDPVN